jgi:HlyD family secretion protein
MTDGMDRRLEGRWRRVRRFAPFAGAAGGLALAIAIGFAFLGHAEPTVRVRAETLSVDTVHRGVFHDFTTLQGRIAPRETVYLDALEGGQVDRLLVQAGDRVSKGQALIVFRNTQLELDVLDHVGRLVESITQLQTYEKQLEQNRADNEKTLAGIDYQMLRLKRMEERREHLAAQGFIARETLDQIQDELKYNTSLRPVQAETNRRQEALRLAQSPKIRQEMAGLQESLAKTRAKLGDLTVRAPVDGRLTAMDLVVGENRNRGERLAEITLDTGFKVSADIDEYYLGRVQLGQIAEADFDAGPRRLKVVRIYPQVKSGVFTADLDFVDKAPAGLVPGQAVQGRLSLGGDRPALILPAGAFLSRTGGDWVFVLTPDSHRAERRRVQLGRRNALQVEVLGGLKPGERVVTSDYQGWDRIQRLDLEH